MFKKLLLLSATLALLILLTACGNDENENGFIDAHDYEISFDLLVVDVEFEATNSIIASTTGYIVRAQVGTRTYLFEKDKVEANLEFINKVEAIVSELENFISIPPYRLTIRSTTDMQNLIFTGSEISLNFENFNTFGWLTHVLSRGELSVWVSAGLEAYIKSGLGLFVPDDETTQRFLSDLYFMPEYLGTIEQRTVISQAYNFVTINGLSSATKTDFTINLINTSVTTTDHEGNSFRFKFYNFDEMLSARYIMYYTEHMVNSISFVIEFFSQFIDFEPLAIHTDIYTYLLPSAISFQGMTIAGATPSENFIEIYNLNGVHVHAHEAAHAVMMQLVNNKLKPHPPLPLEEGLAEYVNLMFKKSTNLNITSINNTGLSENQIREHANDLFQGIYHLAAYYHLTRNDYQSISHFVQPRHIYTELTHFIPEINTYQTAFSFVFYLIQTHGIDKFMGAVWSYDYFAYIYGIDVHDMVVEWREFLTGFVYRNNHHWETWLNYFGEGFWQ